MTVAEAIEIVIKLARVEFETMSGKKSPREQVEEIRAIEIVETIVLNHYKPEPLDN